MINLYILFGILIVHWLADFVLQTHWQATNKSTNFKALMFHTITYGLIWLVVGYTYALWLYLPIALLNVLLFTIITFIFHTVQDYFTSRWVKYYFDKKNFHNGFVVIGLDQILHYAQLIITFMLLNKG